MKPFKKALKKFLKYGLTVIAIIGFVACKKKAEPSLGTDVQDAGDALYTVISDSSTIHMHSAKYDSIRSYQDQYKYLGSNQDPVFGRTNAGIFTNFSLPNSVSNISFGEDAVLDSAELILTFTQSFVGDSTTPLRYQVYQLTQLLDKNKSYYTHNSSPFSSGLLCDATRRISKTGSFYTIRLPLNSTYAAALISNPAYLVNNSVFQNTYKGFYITTKNSVVSPALVAGMQGALMKIDLDNPTSGVYVYYHNGLVPSSKDPKIYRFPFSGNDAARFNKIEYDYSSGGIPLLTDQLDETDTTKGKQNIFLKGVGGAKSIIRLPFLKNYSDSCPIAVNRAELIFNIDPTFTNTIGNYAPPEQICLVACDANGQEIYVKDQYFTADVIRFGGSYDSENKRYVFNMARHVQDIVSGKLDNYGFYLVVANTDRYQVARRDDKAERAIIGGINNSLYQPRFRLTYVRFPYDK